jgi:glyoxylase I family protein
MKLGKLMIFVTDLDVAKHFYCDVLGFHLKSEDERSLEFEHGDCDLIAFKCRQNGAIDNYSEVARSVFVFQVASIDEAFTDLRAKGVQLLHAEPAANKFGRYAAFSDPFGNVHEIFEPRK